MRKLATIAVALVALSVTGYAVADGVEGGGSPTAVAGTFSATGTSTSSRSCTTSDGHTIVVTMGRYAGTASGAPDLAGPIKLTARSVVDQTSGVGLVTGRFAIDVATGANTVGAFTTVYDHGQIAGVATGRARAPRANVVANLSASFAADSGFSNGKLGGGTSGGSAVELTARACKPAKTVHERSQAHGTISAISSSSISVAGLTCAIPSGSDVGSKYKQGDVVTIRCAVANGTNTLTNINPKHH